jgi:two-component system sensor histidine kinase BaeS
MRPLAQRSNVVLVLDTSARAIVDGEPSQLARVLRNLIDNAIRHSPDGGSVRVVVGVEDSNALVRVCDHGSGFADHIRSTAFEAFTRADEARDVRTGTAGLGLAIARGIVVAHGGEIGIGDGPGGEVWFTMPLAVSRAPL